MDSFTDIKYNLQAGLATGLAWMWQSPRTPNPPPSTGAGSCQVEWWHETRSEDIESSTQLTHRDWVTEHIFTIVSYLMYRADCCFSVFWKIFLKELLHSLRTIYTEWQQKQLNYREADPYREWHVLLGLWYLSCLPNEMVKFLEAW